MSSRISVPRPVFTSIATGMLLMAVFTLGWGLGPFFIWGVRGIPIAVVAAATAVILSIDAIRLLRETRSLPRATTSDDRARGARIRRLFGITFGVEGVAIAIASTALSIADWGDFIPAVVALIVAVHFYPFARIFQRKIDYVFASFLAVAAILSLAAMAIDPGSTRTVIALVSTATALTTASYGLYFAEQHRRLRRPTGPSQDLTSSFHTQTHHTSSIRTTVAAIAIVMGGSLAGIVVMFVAAAFSSSPTVFLGSGQLAFATVVGLGSLWLYRREGRTHRHRWSLTTVAAGVVLVAAFWTVAVAPSPTLSEPAEPVAGQQYWQLPSGSRLRFLEIPAQRSEKDTPIIFVHGGPGTPDLAGDSAFFGQLASSGHDVYVYDEVGSGGSTRLGNVADYTLQRDVGDLEEIRQQIGADRMILIGHSYGARVVASYLADHPDHVERVVFSSPASLDPTDTSGGNVTSRLDSAEMRALYSRLLKPRNLLVYGLLQVNPAAAHRLAGDAEMDAENDAVYAITEPGLHCNGQALAHPPTGLGFYRLQYPQSLNAPPGPDLRPALHGNATPVLVIKGACDYLSWQSAITYTDTFNNASLIYLPAGHNAYQDAPAQYLDAVRAFLTELPQPDAIAAAKQPPYDYQH